MNSDTYTPIACSLHDEYEIAIMHKKYLVIKWQDDNGSDHSEKVLPKDILVKDKEEFLVAYIQGNSELVIRLDKIEILD